MDKKIYVILFSLLMILLFLPLTQKQFNIFKIKPLNGVNKKTESPELTLSYYKSNKYQQQLEKYISENFGFREPVIRLYNQYAWSFYRKNFNKFYVPGKKNWIFYSPAVRDYYGQELLRKFDSNEEAIKSIDAEVKTMCTLRDSLLKYNIEFLSFMAPDKAFIYPEYLPANFKKDTTTVNASEYYNKKLTEAGFPNIDMTAWFKTMKDTATFPLFKKMNFHWGFTAIYGFDSLFRMMNHLNDFGIPKIHLDSIASYKCKVIQSDEAMLNLMFHVKDNTLYYKGYTSVEKENCHKPKVLFVGDSFIWSLENRLPWKDLMDHVEIWYYNKICYDGFNKEEFDLNKLNRLRRVLRADYVVFYSCSHQWVNGTFGFAEKTLQSLSDTNQVKIALKMNEIESDSNWMNTLKIQTLLLQKTLEEVLEMEAKHVLNDSILFKTNTIINEKTLYEVEVQKMIKKLKNNEEAMENIRNKAKKRHIPVDEMLYKDAEWLLKNKK